MSNGFKMQSGLNGGGYSPQSTSFGGTGQEVTFTPSQSRALASIAPQANQAAGGGALGGAAQGALAGASVGGGLHGAAIGAGVGLLGGLMQQRAQKAKQAAQAKAQGMQNIASLEMQSGQEQNRAIQGIISNLRSSFTF